MTFPNDWTGRFPITSDSTKVSAGIKGLAYDLSNAPSGFWGSVKSDGSDIRITSDEAGTTQVARDVISIDTSTETGFIRFDTGDISTSSDDTYYLWAGNESATEPAVSDTYGQYNAYDSAAFIFPLEEGSGTSVLDRSSAGNNGTLVNTPAWITNSVIGENALDVSGGARRIEISSLADYLASNSVNAFRFTGWFDMDSLSNSNQGLLEIGFVENSNGSFIVGWGGASGASGFFIRLNDGDFFSNEFEDRFTPSGMSAGTYHKISVSYDGSNVRFFFNGALEETFSYSTAMNWGSGRNSVIATYFRINDSGISFQGKIDDLKMQARHLTADEELTEYNNEFDNASFWTTGTWELLVSGFISSTAILNGSPVEGATVRLFNQSTNSYVGETVTNASGEYSFEFLDEDSFYHVFGEYKDGSNDTYQSFSFPYVKPEVDEE